jgi:hypothetical protein
VRRTLEAAAGLQQLNTAEQAALLDELAKTPRLVYETHRIHIAEALGWRAGVVAAELAKRRKVDTPDTAALGGCRPIHLPDVEPWPEPVNYTEVLNEVRSVFNRYLAVSKGIAVALTLWCAHTHCYREYRITPRLAIISPEMQCGKTTVMELLSYLCPKAMHASGITASAVFGIVETARPTLLLDEADTYLDKREE